MPTIGHRHDILIFFDVTNGNPNGDPDAGNMPRIEPNSGRGLVSDVCLKRKVRDYVAALAPSAPEQANQFGIMVQQGVVLNSVIRAAEEHHTREQDRDGVATRKETRAHAARDTVRWLCRRFYDIRTFGMVLSTGDKQGLLTGSAYGQVRGPVQFTLGMSLDPIATQEITLTRCAVTREEDAAKERTMGARHILPYALYLAKVFISPIFAERTGFDDADLELFLDALTHMFSHDCSAARAEMNVRALYDFEHVGTQRGKSAEQNHREARLGCAHAHRLFDGITFRRTERSQNAHEFPTGFHDYELCDHWKGKEDDNGHVLPGVTLHRVVDPSAYCRSRAA
jgi:CRISPR-associated protein Csd2